MNNFSQIRSLKQLQQEKQQLQKRARRQESAVLNDLNGLHASAQKWINGVFRLKNIASFFLPKLEFATVLFPVLKRVLRKRKK